jgi:DME family drug/metabolite transporter
MHKDADTSASRTRQGVILGMVAAIAYSLANLALRQLSDSGQTGGPGWDVWVTALKTVATCLSAWAIVLYRHFHHQPAWPPVNLIPVLLLAAVVMQFGGNLCFQIALGYLGLAITVPVIFACIICVGAIAGRALLGDPLTKQVVSAMFIMMIAVVLLSIGTVSEVPDKATTGDIWRLLTGIGVALISGCSYGLVGVLIRYFVRSTLAVESVLIVFSSLGITSLSATAIGMSGWTTIWQTTLTDWPMLTVASVMNAIAFFAVSYALRTIDVNRMNVINASQNAMCAIGAVVLFREQLSSLAVAGIALTIVGLLVLGRRRPDPFNTVTDRTSADSI